MKILLYPEFEQAGDYSDVIARVAWYLQADTSLECFVLEGGETFEPSYPDTFDPAGRGHFKQLASGIKPVARDELRQMGIDRILCWSSDEKSNAAIAGELGLACPVLNVDRRHDRGEGQVYANLFDRFHGRPALELIDRWADKVREITNHWKVRYRDAWILATGPSLDQYRNFDFSESFVVTCNSTIIDDEFLTATNPDIVVFADPIFHFGCSRYAGEFRAAVLDSAARHDFLIAVPENYFRLAAAVFEPISERILTVPFDRSAAEFNCDLTAEFWVKPTQNILTFLMLPFASTVSRNLRILGCDGRPLEQDDYFWSHNKSTQLNDEMDNIQQVHPSFFKVDYNEYYLEHCRFVADIFQTAERGGVRIRCESDSFIPALGKRSESGTYDPAIEKALQAPAAAKPGSGKTSKSLPVLPDNAGFISVNPSLHDDRFGHALQQDTALRSQWDDSGGETPFASLAHSDFSRSIPVDDEFVIGTFSDHTWTLAAGDYPAERFCDEFLAAARPRLESNTGEPPVFFLYMGHWDLVPALAERLEPFADSQARFVLNLFSGFFHGDPGEIRDQLLAAGAAIRDTLDNHPDSCLRLCTDTAEVAGIFDQCFGIRLPVLPIFPHSPPSDDAPEPAVAAPGERLRAVYSSYAEAGRGFPFLRDVISAHGENLVSDFEFIIRGGDWQPNRETELSELSRYATVLYGKLPDDDYRRLVDTADLLILPYPPDRFQFRTSSILAEAIERKIPVAVCSGTWLARQVMELGIGVTFDHGDEVSFLSALGDLKRGYEAYRNNCVANGPAWLAKNSAETFFQSIQSTASGPPQEPGKSFSKWFESGVVSQVESWIRATRPSHPEGPAPPPAGNSRKSKSGQAPSRREARESRQALKKLRDDLKRIRAESEAGRAKLEQANATKATRQQQIDDLKGKLEAEREKLAQIKRSWQYRPLAKLLTPWKNRE